MTKTLGEIKGKMKVSTKQKRNKNSESFQE